MEIIKQAFEYEYLTNEVKKKMLVEYLHDLEANHYSLALAEPSKLQEPQPHLAWTKQIEQMEQVIMRTRTRYLEQFGAEEE